MAMFALVIEACGPSAPSVRPASGALPATSGARAQAPDDVSLAAEPKGVALVARIRGAAHVMSQGFAWLGLAVDPSHLIPSFGNKPMPFDLSASVDVLLLADEATPLNTQMVLSLPIRSIDEMKDALGERMTWRTLDRGAFLLVAPAGSRLPGASSGSSVQCALAPSAGAAKARLVCAEGDGLERSLPYLTRTLPGVAIDHDVVVDARRAFLQASPRDVAATVELSLSGIFPAVTDFAKPIDRLAADFPQFTNEIDRVGIAMDADTDGLRIEAHVAMKRRSPDDQSPTPDASVWSQLLTTPSDGPPEPFFRLPGDVDLSFFGAGSSPAAITALRATSASFVADSLLAKVSLGGRGPTLTHELFDLATGPWALGWTPGTLPSNAQQPTGALVAAVRTPYEHVAELARQWVSKGAATKPRTDPDATRLREVKPPSDFPKESIALDSSLGIVAPATAPQHGAPKKVVMTLHWLFVGQGPWTWVAVSASDLSAADLLRKVMATTPKGSVGERPEAAWFRGHPLVSGSEIALGNEVDPALLGSVLGDAAKSIRLPAPAPLLFSTEVAPGDADELILRVKAPPALSVAAFLTMFKGALSASSAPP